MRVETACRHCPWLCMLALMCFVVNPANAQSVQTGHYAPGWNGNLKAGMMAPDPGFYMQSTTMYFKPVLV